MGTSRQAAGKIQASSTKLYAKSAVNLWMSTTLNGERQQLALGTPVSMDNQGWVVPLLVKRGRPAASVGEVQLDGHFQVTQAPNQEELAQAIAAALRAPTSEHTATIEQCTSQTKQTGLLYGDGIAGAQQLEDQSVDLLLTDPPYTISQAYVCEQQIPRRLRTNGGDFIMPKGDCQQSARRQHEYTRILDSAMLGQKAP